MATTTIKWSINNTLHRTDKPKFHMR